MPSFSQQQFSKLPIALQRMVLQTIYETCYRSTEELSFHHAEHIRNFILHSTTGKEKRFGRSCSFYNTYGSISWQASHSMKNTPAPKRLTIPGTTSWNRYRITTSFHPFLNSMSITYKRNQKILVRTWNKGDSFIPLGMKGSKKLQDFFTDRKIPREQRKNMPIITDEDHHILAVYNLRIDDRVKVQDRTKSVLFLGVTP